MSDSIESRWTELAPAKLNLALHVRGRRPDGRHDIETLFAFCTDGDRLTGEPAEELSLTLSGPFSQELEDEPENLVLKAARALRDAANVEGGARLRLAKTLPVAAGIGGGSADAAAALRLLTAMWNVDPAHATDVARTIGSDVPACLLSLTALGSGAGDQLRLLEDRDLSGTAVLLVNPRLRLSTREVYGNWDGIDRGPLDDWRHGRNDLQDAATALAPLIDTVLAWLSAQPGAWLVRMSGSGPTCFALFGDEEQRDRAQEAVPREWWHLATFIR